MQKYTKVKCNDVESLHYKRTGVVIETAGESSIVRWDNTQYGNTAMIENNKLEVLK